MCLQQRGRHAAPRSRAPYGYEVTDLVTFDPAPALRLLREHLPTALYAVEDVGVGFKLTAPFPHGELYGDLEYVEFEELPGHSRDQGHRPQPRAHAAGLPADRRDVGLHGVGYAVGWTAWLDLALTA